MLAWYMTWLLLIVVVLLDSEGDVTDDGCFVYYRARVYGSDRGSEGSHLVKGFVR